MDFVVQRRFESLGGELPLACVVLGECLPHLMGQAVWCLPDHPCSGDRDGEQPHLSPWDRDPCAFLMPSIIFASFSSSLKLVVDDHQEEERGDRRGSMLCICVGTCSTGT